MVSQDESLRYPQVSNDGGGRRGEALEVKRTETSDHDYEHGTTNTNLVTSAWRHRNDRDRGLGNIAGRNSGGVSGWGNILADGCVPGRASPDGRLRKKSSRGGLWLARAIGDCRSTRGYGDHGSGVDNSSAGDKSAGMSIATRGGTQGSARWRWH